MSDLSGKFSAVGTQLSTQHEEIMNALDTIATALGAPPPGPTTTLEDVVTVLTQTNVILNGIRSDMNDQLTAIFNTVDTINNNASLNAQRLLSLILQTSCACDDTAPLLPLPIDVTPTTLEDTVKCQRIQYFVDVYKSWVLNIVSYLGINGNVANYRIYNTLNLILDNLSVPDSELSHMPVSTRDYIAGLLNISGAATYINTALFDALNDSAFVTAIQQALYNATNAADGKAAVDAAIASSGISYASIASSMFWSGFANVIYSDVPIVDASAYDGSICAPEVECETVVSNNIISNMAGTFYVKTPTDPYTPNPSTFRNGDYGGWTVRLVSATRAQAVTISWYRSSDHGFVSGFDLDTTNEQNTVTDATEAIGFYSVTSSGDGHFTIELCPPA
jgi:hypothetical protein